MKTNSDQTLSRAQINAALGVLRDILDGRELAKRIGKRPETISRIRLGKTNGFNATLDAMRREFEVHGISFVTSETHDIVKIRRDLTSDQIESSFPFFFDCNVWSGLVCSFRDWETLLLAVSGKTENPLQSILEAKRSDADKQTARFGLGLDYSGEQTLGGYIRSKAALHLE